MNIGVGLGMNYGEIGLKSVIGAKNSGLLIGLGSNPDVGLGYEIGAQISADWFYANIGYGTFGSRTTTVNGVVIESVSLSAVNILIGGMINLGKAKRGFIDLGLGHTIGAPAYHDFLGNDFDQNQFTFSLGFGYRLDLKHQGASNSKK
jgi:hypothetical protein